MVVLSSLIIGIVSGLVASVSYAIMKRMVRPNIKIVDIAIQDTKKGLFIVKIINRTKHRVLDVSYSLQYYQYLPNGYDIKECQPCKNISPTIDEFVNDRDVSNAPSLYAVQYGFNIPQDVLFDEKDKLVFSIKATHPLSNTASYDVMDYSFSNDGAIVTDMAFDAGNNMGVHNVGS